MSETSKADFNGLVSHILDLLVAACPEPLEIKAETLGLPKGEYEKRGGPTSIQMGFYRATSEEQFLTSTLLWLVAEGFIRTADKRFYVATLQTLKLRGALPNTLSE